MEFKKSEENTHPEAAAFLNASEVNQNPTIPYPIGIGFIIVSKVFERFMFLGIQTVLVIYLTSELSYTNDGATIAYHASMGLQFAASLIGAIISDTYLGKFRTILVMSGVYFSGVLLMFIGSIPGINLTSQLSLLALTLLSFGVGCLKPCLISFGGDQFKLPEQAAQVATFFSLFYTTLKVGSLVSTTVAPILRNDVKCFGKDHCFPMVFGSSVVFALLAIGFFVSGSSWYRKSQSNTSQLLKVFHCVIYSLRNRNRESPTLHWLDHSIPEYGEELVNDIKKILELVILYIPIPVYWSLAEQIGSRFTIQATNMNGVLPYYTIKADQFQVMHPLLIIMLIPLFDMFVYPMLKKIGVWRPLHIMTIGGLLTASSFLLAGLLEMRLNETNAVYPVPGECQLRIYNPLLCEFSVKTDIPGHYMFTVNPMGYIKRDIQIRNNERYNNRIEFESTDCLNMTSHLILTENQSVSYLIQPQGAIRFKDSVKKSVNGKHMLRILSANSSQSVSIINDVSGQIVYEGNPDLNLQISLLPSKYKIIINDANVTQQTEFKAGGVSTLLLMANDTHTWIEITPPNEVHILWQLPQYICMASGDVMFSITGLAFTYGEAPSSLKTVVQAIWLSLIAIGNGLDMVVVAADAFKSQMMEFIAFATLLCADMLIFFWLASRYQRSK